MLYDLAVIGGGASGLAASVAASGAGEHVVLIEAGNAIGKKILASGNGRCNLMNTGELRYYGNTGFAETVLERCGAKAQKRFWNSIGLITAEDHDHRVYPCTYQSASVLQVLKTALHLRHVDIMLNTPADGCRILPDRTFEVFNVRSVIKARRILIATGGPAGRKYGEEIAGYKILRSFGHSVSSLRPALVSLNSDPKSISGLSGIRVRCGITLFESSGNTLHQEEGELLFTDTGISGICTMQCARFIDGNGYYIEADLLKQVFPEDELLMNELRFRKTAFGSMPPDTLLIGMMNAKLAYAVMKQAGTAMKGERLDDLDYEFLGKVLRAIRHYRIGIQGTRRMEDAQVTAGGADCGEFNPVNMESRIVPGLHAAGEILDTDGDCGGYNLMFAFGSGILAGLNGQPMKFSGDGEGGQSV